ncbi:MAG TPA: hypothetical protein PK771_14900, partial [Spirochaetota bacterium]|nr:hypothetical protein [Spirochaetota bacterium]
NFIRTNEIFDHDPILFNTLIFGECSKGCTQVINYKTKEMISEYDINLDKIVSHDVWCHLMCIAIGKIIVDNSSTLKFRRHSNNVTPFHKTSSTLKYHLWRFKTYILNNSGKKLVKTFSEFYRLYKSYVNEDDSKLFDLFADEKYNLIKALKKFFYPKRFRKSYFDEFAVRFAYLFGKL